MKTPHRLFDCLDILVERSPDSPLLAGKERGSWRTWSVREVNEKVEQLAVGLMALGLGGNDMSVEGRDKVAILAKNRPEWVILDLAVQKCGAVLVPVYPTVHINDLAFVLNDAQVKLVIVNDAEMLQKVDSIREQCPSVAAIYSFEAVASAPLWTELLRAPDTNAKAHLEAAAARIDTEDLFTIIYTSGTTGTPKGVMLSHHNVLSNVLATQSLLPVGTGSKVLSFLPLNHIFERTVTFIYLFAGVTIYYAESLDTLGDNLKEVKPEMFTTVPRLLEKVYEKILAKAQELTGIKKKLFFWALRLGERYDVKEPGSAWYRFQLKLANKLIFSKWREGLGNNLRAIVTGAAACPSRLIRIFTAGGIPIMEGYGQTESSPVISVNRIEPENRRFGTVGPVIDGVTVKIAEDGEVLCKGPNVMMGYYKRPDLTEEVVKDGWLYTGDIGELVEGKFLKITDRKKEIFKTSGGKFVAPLPIETRMVESPYIEQIMVVGDGQKFTAALVVPNFARLQQWCGEQAIAAADREALCRNPKVQEFMQQQVDAYNSFFNNVERVKKIALLPREWSIEGGELTPKLSLKRKAIMSKYADAVRAIYEGA
ncbi:long-chain fatty acid--CoA ligase [Flaviaesturariibacter flavus]|uniref:Long-chain fatty acid--CoA ligase n=1 Tax=Flaviaesturariibacter flavus TaxID=2502780 RepID=A0A4R1BMM0_9BACT|nr:long-chain fatty acid--CoA ligase [Flaviaesturariibacter flavus]TCJ18731.1 long-chain fatty acid--CoA ligase [Flaviaesturariibacter flavus]